MSVILETLPSTCSTNYTLNPFSGTCYTVISDVKQNWNDSKAFCERYGDQLATFPTIESAQWFTNNIKEHPGIYQITTVITCILSYRRIYSTA